VSWRAAGRAHADWRDGKLHSKHRRIQVKPIHSNLVELLFAVASRSAGHSTTPPTRCTLLNGTGR
jgi:hypothetical protein